MRRNEISTVTVVPGRRCSCWDPHGGGHEGEGEVVDQGLTEHGNTMTLMTLLRAGLLTAASDFLFATALTVLIFHGTFMRLWQGVAAVPLGREALEGGARTMW